MRYVAKFKPETRLWYVFDLKDQSFGQYGYHSKHSANKRADKLNGAILAAKAQMKKDYGMRHPTDAPPPRAFKD